jgi:hypothetical protein
VQRCHGLLVKNSWEMRVKFFDFVSENFAEYVEDRADAIAETDLVNKTTNPNVQRSLVAFFRSLTFSVPHVWLMVPSSSELGVRMFEGSGGIRLNINERAASGPGTLMILMGPELGGEEVWFAVSLGGLEQYGNIEVFNNIQLDPGHPWVPDQIKAFTHGEDVFRWWHQAYGQCLATEFVARGTQGLADDLEGFAPSLNGAWQMLANQLARSWALEQEVELAVSAADASEDEAAEMVLVEPPQEAVTRLPLTEKGSVMILSEVPPGLYRISGGDWYMWEADLDRQMERAMEESAWSLILIQSGHEELALAKDVTGDGLRIVSVEEWPSIPVLEAGLVSGTYLVGPDIPRGRYRAFPVDPESEDVWDLWSRYVSYKTYDADFTCLEEYDGASEESSVEGAPIEIVLDESVFAIDLWGRLEPLRDNH